MWINGCVNNHNDSVKRVKRVEQEGAQHAADALVQLPSGAE
jgi:hypothetical protein